MWSQGGVFSLLCYSVCFAFPGAVLYSRRCSAFHSGEICEISRKISGLAALLVVTLGTAFLCRGRARELLQAFVVLPV